MVLLFIVFDNTKPFIHPIILWDLKKRPFDDDMCYFKQLGLIFVVKFHRVINKESHHDFI